MRTDLNNCNSFEYDVLTKLNIIENQEKLILEALTEILENNGVKK